MASIALELVRDKDGNIVEIHSFNPYSLRSSADGSQYVQIFGENVVSIFDKKDIVIAKVYHE